MAERPVLVLGGTGLVGRALERRVGASPDRRFRFWGSRDCDLRDPVATRERILAVRPSGILCLASVSGGVGLSLDRPASLLRDNLLMNLNVLEAARRAGGPSKVVLALSSGMYPPDAEQPYAESSIHDGDAHPSNYGYAFAKRMVEPMVRAYRAEYGLPVVGLSPNSIFGEHDHFHEAEASMVAALIRRLHTCRDTNEPIVIWGDGSPLRELSHADDIARDFLWALDHYDEPEILNVGTTEEIRVGEVARLVAHAMGIDARRLVFDPAKPAGVARKRTDNSRYVALSGARYRPVREALCRTVAWFLETAERKPATLRTRSKIRPRPPADPS